MTIKSTDYALLAKNSYSNPDPSKKVFLGGVTYRPFDHADDPSSGFQATAYRRIDTGETVIAYRGTEFDREPVRDGFVDAGMALAGINAQAPAAHAFTQRVMAQAKAYAASNNLPLNVTVTGHSLGGTLAQLQAHKFGLKGETFNAFGAAGLLHGVPEGGAQVINHVRAGDAVSAASAHFGEVRIYAVQQDIDRLSKAGYREDGGAMSARNPVKATDASAHFADNFPPDGETLGRSIISQENQARYIANKSMVDRYRSDIYNARTLVATPIRTGVQAGQIVGNGMKAAGDAAGQAYIVTRDSVMTGAQRAGMALDETGRKIHGGAAKVIEKLTPAKPWLGSEATPALLLDQPGHPGHGLYKQSLAGLEKINVERGIPSDQRTCNAAGALASAACRSTLTQIDLVAVNDSGDKLIAVQGRPEDAFSKITYVETTVALNTPLAQSSQAFADAQVPEQEPRPQQSNPPVQAQAPSGPVMAV